LVQNEFIGNFLLLEMIKLGGFKYYKENDPNSKFCINLLPHVYSFAYALFLYVIYKVGELNDDHQFMNAASMCILEYILELVYIIPTWST
jgi:collagenase-like PrtC family protease